MATEQEFHKIYDLMWQAYAAGLYKKAACIAHQGAELAEGAGNIKWKVRFLVWEGASLHRFDNDQATIPLLQAATYQPEADPANTYSAMATLIEISISTRPVAFTRTLLSQGRDLLRRMGKEAWRHMLDLLEGNLERACFHFQQAQVCYARAWEYYQKAPAYPDYTTASHLYRLCENSFDLQDKSASAEWLAELEQCDKVIELDKQLLNWALLLHQRLIGKAGGKMACLAQEVLKKSEIFESVETNISALRALILCSFAQAAEFYRKVLSIAEKEDARLMVSAYTETVQTRLKQVEKLQQYIREATT